MDDQRHSPLASFLVGAAVGSLLGILLAPASGKETRDRIVRNVKSGKEELDDLIEQARSEWSKAKGKAGSTASMSADEVRDFVRFLFEEGADLKDRLKRDIKDSTDEVTERTRRAADNVRHGAN